MNLRLVDKPEPARKADPRPAAMVQCPACGGRESLETRIGVKVRRDGRPTGGTPALICVTCLAKGERILMA